MNIGFSPTDSSLDSPGFDSRGNNDKMFLRHRNLFAVLYPLLGAMGVFADIYNLLILITECINRDVYFGKKLVPL